MKFYDNPKQMQDKIDSYFKECDDNKKPYSIEGLTLYLGFAATESLLNYEKTEGYEGCFSIIRKAKLKIQQQRVEWGASDKGNPSFIRWILINNSKEYKAEKQIIETRNIDMNDTLSDAELIRIIKDDSEEVMEK